MSETAYVALASEFAQRIRSGDLRPGTQLPSFSEIAKGRSVSDIVVRKAIDLLELQGLVRRVQRRGVFVADQPNLIRVSPERQLESAEDTFSHESDRPFEVDREVREIPVTEILQETFGLAEGAIVKHTVTRVSEDGKPVSISDTYQPVGVEGVSEAVFLEETLSDRIPSAEHASWLKTAAGELVKKVLQQFYAEDGSTLMVSAISYQRNRYDSYVFRMTLNR